jgi:hypothetical protein
MRNAIAIVLVLLLSSPAASAQRAELPAKLIISNEAIARGMAAHPPAAKSPRDSVKNGAVIGAIVGGVIFGGFVTFLCNALQEPTDPSCLGSSLLGIAIGAGGGAAAGAGIDALFMRAPSVRPLAAGVQRQ